MTDEEKTEDTTTPTLSPPWGVVLASIIKPLPEEETEGGIIIPDELNDRLPLVRVHAVGPGQLVSTGEIAPMQVKVGDVCVVKNYNIFNGEFDWFGRRLYAMCEGDVLSVVNNPAVLLIGREEIDSSEAKNIAVKIHEMKEQQKKEQQYAQWKANGSKGPNPALGIQPGNKLKS